MGHDHIKRECFQYKNVSRLAKSSSMIKLVRVNIVCLSLLSNKSCGGKSLGSPASKNAVVIIAKLNSFTKK
jgi:hypothetical protein